MGNYPVEACNNYVDELVDDLRQDHEYFRDPYEIEEETIRVYKNLIFTNYTVVEASVTGGHIFGLSTLHRDQNVVVDKNEKTHLKICLGAGEMIMQCNGKVKLKGQSQQFNVRTIIMYIVMKMDIVPTQKGSNPKIENFSIEDMKGLDVKVSGIDQEWINIFRNNYISVLGEFFEHVIRAGLEDRLKSFLDKRLKKYEIPENCLTASS